MSAKTIVACRFVEQAEPQHLSEKLQLKYQADPFLYALAVTYAAEAESAGMNDQEIEDYVNAMMT